MNSGIYEIEKAHLANTLTAIQRQVVFFMYALEKIKWPLTEDFLAHDPYNETLFNNLAAVNERFAKLQDTMGMSMRHAGLILGQNENDFLKLLTFYEKENVISSIDDWQNCRLIRNRSAHEYDNDYHKIADHFNLIMHYSRLLISSSVHLIQFCLEKININPDDKVMDELFRKMVDKMVIRY